MSADPRTVRPRVRNLAPFPGLDGRAANGRGFSKDRSQVPPRMRAQLLDDTGGPGPPLAYVPGVDGTGELLLGTAARLAERFLLLRFRYVHEGGELSGDGYVELAASIVQGLDRAGVDRSLILAESFGVAVALRIALDHPERVRALALVNGFARYDRRFLLGLSRLAAGLVPEFLFDLVRRHVAPMVLFGPRRDPVAERTFVALVGNRFDAGYRRRLAMIARVDLVRRLPEIRCPVLLFASEKDRIVPSVMHATRMAAALPEAKVERLPRSGHVVLPLADEPWVQRMEALAARSEG